LPRSGVEAYSGSTEINANSIGHTGVISVDGTGSLIDAEKDGLPAAHLDIACFSMEGEAHHDHCRDEPNAKLLHPYVLHE
jgi:hypothetical protein